MVSVFAFFIRIGLVVAGAALLFSVLAGATLSGIVVRERLKGPAVAGVAVSASDATQTLSRSDGSFTLNFSYGNAGQEVFIRAGDKDWAVVNEEALDTQLPYVVDADRFDLTIVVARPAELQQRRAELFGLAGREAAKQSYRKQLAELQAKLQLTEPQRALEQQQLERALEQATAMSDDWAQTAAQAKPDDTARMYRQALTLYTQGQSEEALKLLSDEALEREAREAQDKQQQNVLSWQLKAQVMVTGLNFGGAAKAYEQATRWAPESFDAWFGYAHFNHGRDGFQSARQGYERAMALARDANNPEQVAKTLNDLGLFNRAENRNGEAQSQFEEALKIRRELAQDNPAVHLQGVAITLYNLADLGRAESRNDEARLQYEEALKLYRQLAQDNPAVHLPGVAITLYNLGNLSKDEKRNDVARLQYEEALKLYRQLAQEDTAVYLPVVAITLYNLGNLSREENRKDQAQGQYDEVLKLYRELALGNPGMYLPYVAATLNNLGYLSRDENRKDEARRQFEEALALFQQLATNSPGMFKQELGIVERNLKSVTP